MKIWRYTKHGKNVVECEIGNDDNIIWYEDEALTVIAPCYYNLKTVYRIIKRYRPKSLIVNNMIDCAVLV